MRVSLKQRSKEEGLLDTLTSGAYSFFAYVEGLLMLSLVLLLLSMQRDRDAVCRRGKLIS